MPTLPVEVTLVHEQLADGSTFAQALLFPELSTLSATRTGARLALAGELRELLEKLPPDHLLRRARPPAPAIAIADVVLDPPRRSALWVAPLTLSFPYVCWEHARMRIAFVPSLGIECLAESDAQLAPALEREILLALG